MMGRFPAGLYWIRMEVPSIGLSQARYEVLWLFPTGAFRYIACWPGYTWFEASGRWQYGNGLIHCRGKSSSSTDDFSNNHDNCLYTTEFTACEGGQALASVEVPTKHFERLSPQQVWPLYTLDERDVPTRWQDFQTLMWKIERQVLQVNGKQTT